MSNTVTFLNELYFMIHTGSGNVNISKLVALTLECKINTAISQRIKMVKN
jgi:hypothetical protein